ncbi:hypothetical protein H7I53_13635 [Mycolicibacterium pulveris]|uniref:hypothetical protein n=1 Tax=Mycolicibacterium pulveris TaxID=36813 RepID=UPI0013D44E0F|nr:hypothetical protein [Mycolicibacterium pulveris]MCV6981264.1 hypothetical protein [Mycolicibacterium pulveris]
MNNIAAIALGAAAAYANGGIDEVHFQRTTALCTLWAQGVDKPTIEQIEERIRDFEVAASFISAAPTKEQDQ